MEQTSAMVLAFFLLFTLLASSEGRTCSVKDIQISQGPVNPLPSGIPAYLVEISNLCSSGCSISNIHVNCGMFSSATLVNPHVFKRLKPNDCLVNGGQPLAFGRTLSFKYATTFPYTLTVSSVTC